VFWRISTPFGPSSSWWIDASFVFIDVVFFLTSRNTLERYYRRTADLLSDATSD
jgi:TRAP-type mannitol/chloroaromatic compound transport system permease small subunit